jgi:hypothetical protein
MCDIVENFNSKVVVTTPTYNRRHFLPLLIYQFNYQDYPKELLSLIILDDSDDSNEDIIDLLSDKRVTYIYCKDRRTIGEKRNILNRLALEKNADYIVCFDDDDYYPSDKISYSVKALEETGYDIGGTSKILIYDIINKDMYESISLVNRVFPGHASNGTLIFSRKYAELNSYDDNAKYNEEKHFLRNYRVHLLQLDYLKTIICISHDNNTIDKHKLNLISHDKTIDKYITDRYLLDFYNNYKNS